MQSDKAQDAFLDRRLDAICIREGFADSIEHEVEALERDGLPAYVSQNGNIIDLKAATQIQARACQQPGFLAPRCARIEFDRQYIVRGLIRVRWPLEIR